MVTTRQFRLMRTVAAATFLSAVVAAAPFSMQSAFAEDEVVLGSSMDEYSEGYGTVRPEMITQNSMCANVVHDIIWDSWGEPVAQGAGTACQSAGDMSRGEDLRRVSLNAFDLGDCHGNLAYRMLQYNSSEPFSICGA